MIGLLEWPVAYKLWISIVGGKHYQPILAKEYIRAIPGSLILDVGCGTADILNHLPEVNYHGIDSNLKYINDAKIRFHGRGTFQCLPIDKLAVNKENEYDLCLVLGVLHHLNDGEVLYLLSLLKKLLKPGGRVITFDGCFDKNQSMIARLLLQNDRGRYVRWQSDYENLGSKVFSSQRSFIRDDILRIPYTHLIMELTK